MAANTNGLIYYKLDATSNGYLGDVTKNCGLRGEEIDGNFNFLRGNDIKSIAFDKDGTIHLVRYNGELLTAKSVDTPNYDFKYDSIKGTITITTPDGEEIILDGFNVSATVYHDNTLEGEGSIKAPLHISNIAKTGRFRPAIKLIDTLNGEQLPTKNIDKNARYVTKEIINIFGCLYPLSGVQEISKRLIEINSEWRVPTKQDWDEMLNTIDCANPEHGNTQSNVFLGEHAGAALKSHKYWKKDGEHILSDDKYDFSILPVGYAGNRGTGYYGSFGESAAFWTATEEDPTEDMYVKLFEYNEERVGQRTWGENYYLSLRLVKTFTGENFNSAEDIDGMTTNCVHVSGCNLIWTQTNVAFNQSQYKGFEPTVWEDYKSEEDKQIIRYFVNDWNGERWTKHEIKEGEGIVLHESPNGEMHEWILLNGELTDATVIVKGEFDEEFNTLNQKIDKEIEDRVQGDTLLAEQIAKETAERIEADNALLNQLNNEIATREEVDGELQKQITENKITLEDNSLVITPGTTEGEITTSTLLKVNIDTTCEHIKLGENGIYFDGYFGQF